MGFCQKTGSRYGMLLNGMAYENFLLLEEDAKVARRFLAISLATLIVLDQRPTWPT
jgi:hypothetical protein